MNDTPDSTEAGINWTVYSDGFMPTLEPHGGRFSLARNTHLRVELAKDANSNLLTLKPDSNGNVRFSAYYRPENKLRHFSASRKHFEEHCKQEDLTGRGRARKIRNESAK